MFCVGICLDDNWHQTCVSRFLAGLDGKANLISQCHCFLYFVINRG